MYMKTTSLEILDYHNIFHINLHNHTYVYYYDNLCWVAKFEDGFIEFVDFNNGKIISPVNFDFFMKYMTKSKIDGKEKFRTDNLIKILKSI